MSILPCQNVSELMVRVPWIALHLAGAGCILLWLSTRLMGHVHNLRIKHPLMYLLAVLMCAAGFLSGASVGGTRWSLVPIAILVAAAGFEIRHAVFRRRHRIPPLSTVPILNQIRRPIGSVRPEVHRHRIALPTWPHGGLTVLHLSDLHIDKHFPEAWFSKAVRDLSALKPDLVFLTGDAVNRNKDIHRSIEILKPLAALAPSFAVLGNHDFWVDGEKVAAALRAAGFTVLRNETREVTVRGATVLINGSEHPWNDAPWAPPDSSNLPLLVLSHTADGFRKFQAAGAVAVFSGHYHAGQVRVPVLGPLLMPSVNGRRFDHGHFLVDGVHLLISAGLGTEYPPMRVLCTPDVFHVEIVGRKNGEQSG